ncbi:MAG: hypothetical protein KDE35_04600 [Geminicoccaceae bacterium]|nr:hypothetical protein [Geminicoccaceae bacterium]
MSQDTGSATAGGTGDGSGRDEASRADAERLRRTVLEATRDTPFDLEPSSFLVTLERLGREAEGDERTAGSDRRRAAP